MDMGIVQVITLLMGLSGFSVGTNPNAPNADQALQYAVPDADIVVHFDAGAVIPANYKVLTNLPNQPAIKAQPELAKMLRKAIAEVDGPKGMALSTTGIDLTKDVSDATAFIQFTAPHQDPNMVVAVHGKFSTANIDKIAKLVGKASVKSGGGAWVDTGDGNAVGVTKGGVLLGGSAALVKDRMGDTWKAPAVSSMQNVADVINTKPVFAVSLQLSQNARTAILGQSQDVNFLTDLVKRHKFASLAIYKDGMGWTWVDSSKAGLDSFQQVSDGTIDILRAAQIAPRGFAKICLGALDSYKGNKQVDELIKHKADLWKIVQTYTGDGQFKAAVNADPKTFKLSVRLTGNSLSEVMPLGGMLPMGVVSWLVFAERRTKPEQMVMPSPTPLPPPPPPSGKKSAPGKHP